MSCCLDLPHWTEIFGQWLYYWQTLFAGGLAIGAAFIGARAIYKQTQQASKLAQNEIDRRHNAARAVLPLALSTVSEICKAIAENIAHAIEARSDDKIGFDTSFNDAVSGESDRKRFENVSIPDKLILELQRFVETLSDAGDIRHMAELVSSAQILSSRFDKFKLDQPGVVEQLYRLLLDTAKVQLLNDRIFNYGRFVDHHHFSVIGTASNSEAWDMIHEKAEGLIFSRHIPDLFFPKIKELIERYKRNDSSPWNEKFEG